MASLQKYSVNGRPYYRIVESKRINGKPTPVPIMHIGPPEELVRRLLSSAGQQPQFTVRSFQHGDVAALKALADRLGVVGIINKHAKSRRKISVGTTILLAALNRAVDPCSKRAWGSWAAETSIHRLFDVDPKDLSSQHFWSCMDDVSIEALEEIEKELTKRVVEEFKIKLDLLFFDPTNFFTYIASDNGRSKLAQGGRNKQKRFDLRQISLALLAARDGLIPLCSRVYEANVPDVKAFPDSLAVIRRRLEMLLGDIGDITLVYDKGNNSRANQSVLDSIGAEDCGKCLQFHWTDQKVRVHIFICLLALMLGRLLHKVARDQYDYSGGVATLLDDSATVRLALVIKQAAKRGAKPECVWMLEDRDNSVVEFFKLFVPSKEPFVYTGQNA